MRDSALTIEAGAAGAADSAAGAPGRLAAPAAPRPAARSGWVDHARGIGILLVVYGHVSRGLVSAGTMAETPLFTLVDKAIYAFHMPLFFFLSGLFFLGSVRKRGRAGLLLSKVEVLVYPYLLWTLLQGGLRVALAGNTNHAGTGWAEVLAVWTPIDQWWFLYGLFFVFLIAALPFHRRVDPRIAIGVLCVLVALLYATPLNVPWIWQDVHFLPFLVYFVLAVVVAAAAEARGGPARGDRASAWLGGAFLLGGIAAAAALALAHRGDLLGAHGAAELTVKAALLGTAGTVAVCGLARITAAAPGFGWLAHLGAVSMLIYVTHTLAASSLRMLLQKGLGVEDPGVHLLLGLAAALAVPLALHRFAPAPLVMALLVLPGPLRLRRGPARNPPPARGTRG